MTRTCLCFMLHIESTLIRQVRLPCLTGCLLCATAIRPSSREHREREWKRYVVHPPLQMKRLSSNISKFETLHSMFHYMSLLQFI